MLSLFPSFHALAASLASAFAPSDVEAVTFLPLIGKYAASASASSQYSKILTASAFASASTSKSAASTSTTAASTLIRLLLNQYKVF